jgi:hypothetical protein
MFQVSSTQRYHVLCNLFVFCCEVAKRKWTTRSIFWTAFNKHRCLRRTVLSNWLTNSTKQSPSSEGNSSQQATKFPAIWNFKAARHISPTLNHTNQSTPSHFISIQFSLILSSHLRLGLLSSRFPSGFPTEILTHFSSSLMHLRHFYSPFLNSQTPTPDHTGTICRAVPTDSRRNAETVIIDCVSQQRRRSSRHKGRWVRGGIAPSVLNAGTVWVQLNCPVCLHGRRRLGWRHSRAGRLGESYFVPVGKLTTAMLCDPEHYCVSLSCHELHIRHIVSECWGPVDGRVFVFQPRQRSRYSD